MRETHSTTRNTGLGGSDIAAILGLSPYRTRFDVYAEKRELVPPFEPNQRMRTGIILQPAVCQMFEEETGRKVEWFDKTIAAEGLAPVIGTPDAFVDTKGEGLEVKTAGLDQAWRWGDGGDLVPEEYLVQCQWYMLLTGLPLWHLAVLIGGDRFKTFLLKSDEDLQSMMLEEGSRFWSEHILKGRQPELDHSRSAREYLKQLYPHHEDKKVRDANSVEIELMREHSRINQELKFLTEQKDTVGNRLKEAIGAGYGLIGEGLKAIWYETKESSYMVTRPAGRTFKVTDKRRPETEEES